MASKQSAGTIALMNWATVLAKILRIRPNQALQDALTAATEENRILRSQVTNPAERAKIDRLVQAEFNREHGLPEDTPLPREIKRMLKDRDRKGKKWS